MKAPRMTFYSTPNRSRRQMIGDVKCLDEAVRGDDVVALGIAIVRKDGVGEITWSGTPSFLLVNLLDVCADDVLDWPVRQAQIAGFRREQAERFHDLGEDPWLPPTNVDRQPVDPYLSEAMLAHLEALAFDREEREYVGKVMNRAFLQAYEAILDARPRGKPDRFTDADLSTEDGIETEAVTATKAPPVD